MSNKSIIFLLIFFLLFLFFVFFIPKRNNIFFEYQINGKKYKFLIADNQEKRQKGLMFYKSKKDLKGADGMIFIFQDKDYRTFWNKNTYLDLDVYWIEDDKVVGKDYLPSILKSKEIITVESKIRVNKVIEIVVSSQ